MESATRITLSSEQLHNLVNLAKDSLPNESCAFLLGRGDSEIYVDELLPMGNADRSMISFSIDPQELLQAYDLAERKKLHIVGIFHSHPSKPVPSSTDTKYMEINPIVWLIYSTTINEFKAYIFDYNMREVVVKVKE
jgi:[CysO sulfur-carrier protein]-S-L-cysteine hydrolase